jgi:transposase
LLGEHGRQPDRLLLVEPLRLRHWIASTASREGVQVYDVPAAYSSRTCSACGDVSVAKSAEPEVVCASRGVIHDRDENAARRAPRWLEKQLQDARARSAAQNASSINGLTGVP